MPAAELRELCPVEQRCCSTVLPDDADDLLAGEPARAHLSSSRTKAEQILLSLGPVSGGRVSRKRTPPLLLARGGAKRRTPWLGLLGRAEVGPHLGETFSGYAAGQDPERGRGVDRDPGPNLVGDVDIGARGDLGAGRHGDVARVADADGDVDRAEQARGR